MNYGFQPRMSYDWAEPEAIPMSKHERDQRLSAQVIAKHMGEIWEKAAEALRRAQDIQARAADKHRQDIDWKAGDMVYLSAKGLPDADRPTEKLSAQFYGPYEIEKQEGYAFRLKLPSTMKIHPVFHPSLLQKADENPLPGQHQEPQGPVRVNDQGIEEWEVEEILDSSWNYPHRRGRKPREPTLYYLVKWKNYPDEDREWYPAYNFEDAPHVLQAFHDSRPTKPGPPKELNSWLLHKDNLDAAEDAER